jgi:chemotaxis protein histidine kinase CheA
MSSTRLLDFFVLEASDYIDRLDALLSGTRGERPDTEALTAQARLLRGSATMARQLPIADLASALERIGRAVRDNIIDWNQEMHGALVAAVDDLKILVRAVRSWGAGDDRRTESRISELASLYPQATKAQPTPPSTLRNASFIASETAQLASALDSLIAHPSGPDLLAVALHRLNSLRGVASVNDVPPLASILTALDNVLRPMHTRGEMPETSHLAALTSAVRLLRRFSQEMAIGGTIDPQSAAVQEFQASIAGLTEAQVMGDDSVIPISRLNFEDGLPQIVATGEQTPGGQFQRLRLEVAGPCELLRHQVALARSARDEMGRRAAAAEMRASLRVLRSTAEGFEDREIVRFLDAVAPGIDQLATKTLTMVEEFARALTNDSLDRDAVHTRLRGLSRAPGEEGAASHRERSPRPVEEHRSATPAKPDIIIWESGSVPMDEAAVARPAASPPGGVPTQPPAAPTAIIAAPVPPAAPPTGAGLSSMLAAGIEGLSGLDRQPLSQPAHIDEDDIVPIGELLYRGQDAISRAREIRDGIRSRAGSPRTEELEELFELLDLAAVD